MKMLYLRSNTRDRSHRRMWRVVLFIALCVGALSFLPVPGAVTSALHTIATPLWYVRDTAIAYVRATHASFEERGGEVGREEALRNRILMLEREVLRTRAYEREVRELRTLLGSRDAEREAVFATVLQSIAYAPRDSFVVRAGTSEGVQTGRYVYTSDGMVVGVVVRTLSDTSMVQSLAATGVCTEATLFSASSSSAVLVHGVGGGTMRILVPRDLEVLEGDVVHTLHDVARVVGVVAEVVFAREDAFQTVYVRPPASVYHTRHVLIEDGAEWVPCAGDVAFSLPTLVEDEFATTTSNE